ncbi:MAG: nicotinate-nicotinamide nucleotide adenylyltransferase [Kofleriaceae bacterium]|nr:nicotinate-nicotinamide nucleotide adenylyltransferase [Kofleriaceae bacterium]
MNVGIFGGSFNPPHLGHQVLCLMLLETCEIDELWVIPTYQHVFGKDLAPYEARRRCCEEMLAPLGERCRVVEIEKELSLAGESEHGSRMLDTLKALSQQHTRAQFRLVIGADILSETDKWHRFDEVSRIAPPIVFQRYGYPGGQLVAPPEISSSDIRDRLARGEPVDSLVPRRVIEVMERERMYQ